MKQEHRCITLVSAHILRPAEIAYVWREAYKRPTLTELEKWMKEEVMKIYPRERRRNLGWGDRCYKRAFLTRGLPKIF